MQGIEHLVLYRIFILIVFTCSIWAQKLPDKLMDKILCSGINSIINQDYDEALQEFNLLNKKYPENPLGNIYSAVVLMTESEDLGEELNDSLIEKYFDESEEQISQLQSVKNDDIWNYYYLALLKGYKAYYFILSKNYLSALGNGLSSIDCFEKCINIDSTFYESYIAIGTFIYWKSEKTEFLDWLPFYTDEKKPGINIIKKGLAIPSYNYYLGMNSLIWICINQQNFTEAIKLSNDALDKYPGNRTFKWCLADAYENVNKKKAISIYNDLLSSYVKLDNNNHYNEIILKHLIAKLYYEIGEKNLALKQCNEILSIKPIQSAVIDRLKERLERVKSLKMKLIDTNIPLNVK
jgi:tetratricopeptide (TPR) repeat protein